MPEHCLYDDNEGSSPSFETLFAKYRSPLIFFAWKLLGDQLVAEDIVTDVFVKYWPKRNSFANFFAAKAFLTVSTRNACLNYLRIIQRKKKFEEFLQNSEKNHEGSVLNKLIEKELISEAVMIMNSLPEKCRRIFYLGYVMGLSNKTLAKRLNLSKHTIKNLKRYGLQIVKKRYEELDALGRPPQKKS